VWPVEPPLGASLGRVPGLFLPVVAPPIARNPWHAPCMYPGGCAGPIGVRQGTTEGDRMGIIAWLILGLIAGFIASKIMGAGGYGLIGDIIVGIVGALLGGFIASLLFGGGVTGLNLGSIIVAIVGACILIAILRAVSGNRARV